MFRSGLLSRRSVGSIHKLLLANLVLQAGIYGALAVTTSRVDCGTSQPMVVMITETLGPMYLAPLFYLMEVATMLLFLVFMTRSSAILAIAVPWAIPVLVVLDDPSSLLVLPLMVIPFVMWVHMPLWKDSEADWRRTNPLPAAPYEGPPR